MNKYLALFLFTLISVSIVIVFLFFVKKYLKNTHEKAMGAVFFSFAIITVFLHYLPLVLSLGSGKPIIKETYYLPVYPCNIIMWQNLFVSIFILINKYNNKFVSFIAVSQFIVGSVCVFFGIALNFNFLNTPTLLDYDISCGLFSHVTLLFCCLLLFIGGYIKIEGIQNTLNVIIEGAVFILCGFYSNAVIKALGHRSLNSMFLEEPPFKNCPFLNTYTAYILIIFIGFILFAIYELIKKPENGLLHSWILKKKEEKL